MITDLLALQVATRGQRPFLVSEHGECSFTATLAAARRFASLLQARGIGRGDHVALLGDNSVPWVIAMLGISWLGAVVVSLNNELLADGLRYTLKQSDAKLIVADARWIEEKSQHLDDSLRGLPLLRLEGETEFFSSLEALSLAPGGRVDAGAACSILYTSGTTGLPKGVVNSHGCYEAVGVDTVAALKLTESDRIMVFLPLFHVNPQMYALMSALTVGCAIIVRRRFSASAFFEDARRFDATGFTFVGTVMSILAIHHPSPRHDHRLRFAIGGGTPTDVWHQVHQRFGFQVHELYGMTEIGGWVSCNVREGYKLGSCGRLRGSMDVRIFDEHDQEVPAGTAGEIVVRPLVPNVILSSYYKNPEALTACCRNLWFHTGDRGTIDAEGYLHFYGRTKELIRRGGEMISPVEIETKLRGMPGVQDCAIVAVADPVMGEEIKAAIVADSHLPPRDVIEYLRPHLPKYMLPRYIEFLPKLPKTETEKIQRNKLQYLDTNVHDLASDRS